MNQGSSSLGIVFPVGLDNSLGSVVSSQSVDSGFNQNQSKFTVLVLSVLVQMLSHSNSLLNKKVQIFRQVNRNSVGLQDSQDLVSSDVLGLRNAHLISQVNADGRWSETHLLKLQDGRDNFGFLDLVFGPIGSLSDIWEG